MDCGGIVIGRGGVSQTRATVSDGCRRISRTEELISLIWGAVLKINGTISRIEETLLLIEGTVLQIRETIFRI